MSTTIDPPKGNDRQTAETASSNTSTGLAHQVAARNFWKGWSAKSDSLGDIHAEWLRHLAKSRRPRLVDDLCEAKRTALGWGIKTQNLPLQTQRLFQLNVLLRRKGKANPSSIMQLLTEWLATAEAAELTPDYALSCLAVAQLLPQLANKVPAELWWSALDALWQMIQRSSSWHIDADVPDDQALVHQLLSGELPLTLAYSIPEVRPLSKLRRPALESLNEAMQELLDSEGMPHARYLNIFRALLACWTRCHLVCHQVKRAAWQSRCEPQFRQAATTSLLLSTAVGTALLDPRAEMRWESDFLAAALQGGGDAADRTAALDLFGKKVTASVKGKSGRVTREPACESEWAGLAILRTEFQRNAPVVAIDYSTPELQIDLWRGKHRIFTGPWIIETWSGDSKLTPVGSWEQTCWFSDLDVDYLELSLALEHDARLERQILLARDDLFLLLVDNIVEAPNESIRHTSRLPLQECVQFSPEVETRDGRLCAERPLARVLPLALPEWRVDPRVGELTERDNMLQLVQQRPGKRMSCPLFIDLNPTRLFKECTWRQLTVAAALEIQPADVAVGYRAQCGKEQWLYYRSLAAPANRTLLGQNTSEECVIGRFLAPAGELEELLEVQG